MAVVTTKSTAITNRDASPSVINDSRIVASTLRSAIGSVAAVSGNSIGSTYIMCSVPSTAMVRAVLLTNTAITTCAADIGVYRNTADGSAVVDADFFGSAVAVTAIQNNLDVTNESATNTLALMQQPLWQAIGMASDPCTTLDIVATLTAAAGSAGFIGLVVNYCDHGS